MTCREAKRVLGRGGGEGCSPVEDEGLTLHLVACRHCGEAMKVAGMIQALLGALREEVGPGASFYPRLRERLAEGGVEQPDAMFLQAWGFARQLVPALALGVLLLAGVMVSLGGPGAPLPVRVGPETEVDAFSMEGLNLSAPIEQPSQDQMLAFVLMRGSGSDGRDAR